MTIVGRLVIAGQRGGFYIHSRSRQKREKPERRALLGTLLANINRLVAHLWPPQKIPPMFLGMVGIESQKVLPPSHNQGSMPQFSLPQRLPSFLLCLPAQACSLAPPLPRVNLLPLHGLPTGATFLY
jgi:hypothetical protein